MAYNIIEKAVEGSPAAQELLKEGLRPFGVLPNVNGPPTIYFRGRVKLYGVCTVCGVATTVMPNGRTEADHVILDGTPRTRPPCGGGRARDVHRQVV